MAYVRSRRLQHQDIRDQGFDDRNLETDPKLNIATRGVLDLFCSLNGDYGFLIDVKPLALPHLDIAR
jgi:hypothetical protein